MRPIGFCLNLFHLIILFALTFSAFNAHALKKDITDDDLNRSLDQLDSYLESRPSYLEKRLHRIEALKRTALAHPSPESLADVADAYRSFNNDSAIFFYQRAVDIAGPGSGIAGLITARQAELLPLAGFNAEAIRRFESVCVDSLSPDQLVEYYDAGRAMYSNITAFYSNYPRMAMPYSAKIVEEQKKLLESMDHMKSSPRYKMAYGEYLLRTGQRDKAEALLNEVYSIEPEGSPLRSRAAHMLSHIMGRNGEKKKEIKYLVNSAIDNILAGDVELPSMQNIGLAVEKIGEHTRAYSYLNSSLSNAVRSNSWMRTIQTSKAIPMVQQAHIDEVARHNRVQLIIIAVLALVLVALLISILFLRREICKQKRTQRRLASANATKEIYISQFLSLCSVYMDRLTTFSSMVKRKISAGKTDDVMRTLKSGKFINEQSAEFFEVFDNAFLNLYPTFVSEVNRLLRPDQQIELREGELMNTDLRILAFMRLGIDDSSKIAQILNYSINTIYAYRNRLKQRAVNRASFESDIMKVNSI